MSKRNKGEIRFAKPTKKNSGAIVIVTATVDGKVMFEMAPQKTIAQGDGNATFDYKSSQFFTLDPVECANLTLMFKEVAKRYSDEKLLNSIKTTFQAAPGDDPNLFADLKQTFFHRKGRSPKDIQVEARKYNGSITYHIAIYDKSNQGQAKNISVNLAEAEMEVIVENLKQHYGNTINTNNFPSTVVDETTGKTFNMMLPKMSAGDFFKDKVVRIAQYDNSEYKMVYYITAVQ